MVAEVSIGNNPSPRERHESSLVFNSLRPRQNRRHFADDVSKCNFLNGNVWIPIKISLEFVPQGPIDNETMMTQFNDAYMRHSASMSQIAHLTHWPLGGLSAILKI